MLSSLRSIRRIPLVPHPSRKLSSSSAPPHTRSAKKLDVSSWTNKKTKAWLAKVQPLGKDDAQVWDALHMDGKSLSMVTADMLEKRGMGFGAALGVVSEIQKLFAQTSIQQTHALGTNVAPQILNAKTLLDCILNNSELQRCFKEDPSMPTTLAQNMANFPRVGRQEAIRDAFAAMTKRKNLRLKNKSATDQLSNPLPATITTTGGGKSRFLDELAAKRTVDLELCEDTTMRGYLENSVSKMKNPQKIEIDYNKVAVTITFNGRFDYTPSIDDKKDCPSLGLALRTLYSYWVGPDNMAFEKFVAALEESLGPLFPKLTLKMAVACIAVHSGKGVLLLVDELMKCAQAKENPIGNVVSAIGSCLNSFNSSQFNILVTTLNSIAFTNETRCGREIIWILLPPANSLDAFSLFADAKNSLPLRLCIIDCGGHFYSLDTLALLWLKVSLYNPPLSYAQLSRCLGASIDPKYSISLPLVKAALLGLPVKSTNQCPGTNITYGDCLAMGIFLNTPAGVTPSAADLGIETDTPDQFIPRVTPVQLRTFAEAFRTAKDTKEYPYATTIAAMLALEPMFVHKPGAAYEKFHAHWETLVRLLYQDDTEPWTIEQLYKRTPEDNSPKFYMSAKTDLYYPWPTRFPLSLAKNAELLKFPAGALSRVIIPTVQNHPGFNMVSFEQKRADGESEPIIICTECQFSSIISTKSLTKAEVAKKRKLTVEQFRPFFGKDFGGLTLKEDNLFLIICAFRQVNNSAMKELPANTIVLNRDMLKKLYSPSLAGRPQFILPLKEGEWTQYQNRITHNIAGHSETRMAKAMQLENNPSSLLTDSGRGCR